jgi:hypothetical protein
MVTTQLFWWVSKINDLYTKHLVTSQFPSDEGDRASCYVQLLQDKMNTQESCVCFYIQCFRVAVMFAFLNWE